MPGAQQLARSALSTIVAEILVIVEQQTIFKPMLAPTLGHWGHWYIRETYMAENHE